MSKKNRLKNRHAWQSRNEAKFQIGMTVAVKSGVADPAYPDLPLGGWVGVICDVDFHSIPRCYRIEWSQRTLAQIHNVHRRRCERDGFDLETLWLPEDSLQLFAGEEIAVEQPKNPVVDLAAESAGARIRAMFGVQPADPLPAVNLDSLRKLHRYLRANLVTPFIAMGSFTDVDEVPLVIAGLLDADAIELEYGIECAALNVEENHALAVPLADLETDHPHNRLLIEAYTTWYRGQTAQEGIGPAEVLGSRLAIFGLACLLMFIGAGLGTLLGTLLSVFEIAHTLTLIGACSGALLGYAIGSCREESKGREARLTLKPNARILGYTGILAVAGAILGAVVIATPGVLAGAAAAVMLVRFVLRQKGVFWPATIGGFAGSLGFACYWDFDAALSGAGWGAAIGAGGGALAFGLMAIVVNRLAPATRSQSNESPGLE